MTGLLERVFVARSLALLGEDGVEGPDRGAASRQRQRVSDVEYVDAALYAETEKALAQARGALLEESRAVTDLLGALKELLPVAEAHTGDMSPYTGVCGRARELAARIEADMERPEVPHAAAYEMVPEDCWATPDAELIRHDDRNEAIADSLDSFALGKLLPARIEIARFRFKARNIDPQHLGEHISEFLVDTLDDDLGNPEEAPPLPGGITKAIDTLAEACAAQWPVWQMDRFEREWVDVLPWVREHRPEWIEEDGVSVCAPSPDHSSTTEPA